MDRRVILRGAELTPKQVFLKAGAPIRNEEGWDANALQMSRRNVQYCHFRPDVTHLLMCAVVFHAGALAQEAAAGNTGATKVRCCSGDSEKVGRCHRVAE